jgi:hypothetical protein
MRFELPVAGTIQKIYPQLLFCYSIFLPFNRISVIFLIILGIIEFTLIIHSFCPIWSRFGRVIMRSPIPEVPYLVLVLVVLYICVMEFWFTGAQRTDLRRKKQEPPALGGTNPNPEPSPHKSKKDSDFLHTTSSHKKRI